MMGLLMDEIEVASECAKEGVLSLVALALSDVSVASVASVA